ncbi:uncharacterized protein LOC112572292 [Pomacea canaliculata]|uniref:uncharacterized protein LOC112572292 n=1 Tax=Pomacea canaliculata TaxID=400727 RepID=UPI000D732259|nr:uncharacterized protein LOC112572292 [Pomacea canaliculata]
MAGESALVLSLAVAVCGVVAAGTGCLQTSALHFLADDSNCSTFYVCVMGQRSAVSCPRACLRQPDRQLCASLLLQRQMFSTEGSPGSLSTRLQATSPHPTKCAQYYDCGATFTWWQQRDVQLRECPAPLVFSPVVHTCVFPAPGCVATGRSRWMLVTMKSISATVTLTASRARFASRPVEVLADGVNTWRGRRVSPFYVLCRQQRVVRSGMCKQEGPPRPLTQRRTRAWTTRERSWKRSSITNPPQPTNSTFQTYIPLGVGYQLPTNLNRQHL